MTGSAILAARALAAAPAPAQLPAEAKVTAGGILLSSPWRAAIYAHAREKLLHPAWGWRHSERDFLLARQIAREEGLTIDEDVLFAAAFLHDSGAIPPFAKDGVDHAVRSAELAEPLLRKAGFPMAKFPAVKAAILGHMFDKKAGAERRGGRPSRRRRPRLPRRHRNRPAPVGDRRPPRTWIPPSPGSSRSTRRFRAASSPAPPSAWRYPGWSRCRPSSTS